MPCIVPLCQNQTYRNRMCKYHHKQSTFAAMRCTHAKCVKMVFALSLCREHYRKAYTQCFIDGCRRPVHCKNVCRSHYRKGRSVPSPPCSVPRCKKKAWMRGKCRKHFVSEKPIQCMRTDCKRPVRCSGLCTMHYFRERRKHQSSS